MLLFGKSSLVSLNDSRMVSWETLQQISHSVVRILLSVVLVEWKRIAWLFQPSVLVGEAPGLEALAVCISEASVQDLVVDRGLQLLGSVVPASAAAVSLSALDVDLGKVDLDAELVVSLQVLIDVVRLLAEVNVLVQLEADTVDWASSLLQVLDHIIDGIASTTIPAAISRGVTIVVVEELSSGIGLMSPLE